MLVLVHVDALQADVGRLGGVQLLAGLLGDLGDGLGFQLVDVADEVADELGGGVVVDLVRGADLLDDALVEYGDLVRQSQSFFLIVRDVDGGDAELGLQLLELVAQLHAQLGVQVRERLVQTHDGRLGHQRAGDGDALLLAAGELADLAHELLLGQFNLRAHFTNELVDLGLVHLLDAQTEGDVLVHGHGREEGVVLEHHADVALLNRDMGDVLILDDDGARSRLDEAGDGAQGGRLAAAGRAKEGEELAFLNMNVDVLEGRKVAETDLDTIQMNHTRLSFVD